MWLFPMKTRQSFLSTPTFCRTSVNLFLTLRILFLKLKTTLFPQIWSSSCQSLFVMTNIFPPPEAQLSIILILKDFWFPSARELQLQKAITPKIKAFIFFFNLHFLVSYNVKCKCIFYIFYFLSRKKYFLTKYFLYKFD